MPITIVFLHDALLHGFINIIVQQHATEMLHSNIKYL